MSKASNAFSPRNGKPDRPPAPTPPAVPKLGSPVLWLLVAALAFLLFRGLFEDVGARRVSYSQIKEAIRVGKIEKVTLSNDTVKVRFAEPPPPAERGPATTEPAARGAPPVVWLATRVTGDEELLPLLEQRGLDYEGVTESGLMSLLLVWVLPLVLVFFFWSYMFRRTASQIGQGPPGVMSFGKSRARVYVEQHTNITFADVAGVDEAADELKEIVEFLKTPDKFRRLGGKIPKGVLLVGPPGTGKTLLARAVAGEASVPFFSLSGSEFVEMFVGVGAARVRDLFAQASAKGPCIIFIDELDAIGKARNAGVVSGHDEREQTLNQLLAEMDGFDPRVGLIVLAATNRPEILDPALMRPGRFDRHVLVDRPDKRGREKILEIHARDVKLGADVKLREVAARTPGFAGADLANIVNESALLAGRAGREFVTMRDFDEAIERVTAGLEKKTRRINEKEKEIVAYHESGHALVSTMLPHADQVQKVSIIPRGLSALGYTRQTPLEDRYLMSAEELADRIAALFGGRAAEEEMVGTISTGASNDLRQATEIARMMVAEYGMSPSVGPISLLDGQRNPFLQGNAPAADRSLSERTAQQVDAEVSRLIHEGLEKARALVRHNRSHLERLAARLMTVEALDGEEVREILRDARLPPSLLPPPLHLTTGDGDDFSDDQAPF
jgi:cell division protease FtsH